MKIHPTLTHVVAIAVFASTLVGATPAFAQDAAPAPTRSKADVAAQLLHAPLHFEPNWGQADEATSFVSRTPGSELRLDSAGASLALLEKDRVSRLRISLAGQATGTPGLAAEGKTAGVVTYKLDKDTWLRNVPTYERVRYTGVYPGVDLIFYGNQQKFEYDFVVAPGADPAGIRVRFAGADRVALEPSGDLLLQVGGRTIRQQAPVIYQDIAGARRAVTGRYRMITASEIAFDVDAYDTAHTLVIDPVIDWSHDMPDKLGGFAINSKQHLVVASSDAESIIITEFGLANEFIAQYREQSPEATINGMALDVYDNVYLVGITRDFEFDATGGVIPNHPETSLFGIVSLDDLFSFGHLIPGVHGILTSSENGFLIKVNAALNTRMYATFLGGDGDIGGFASPVAGGNFLFKKVTGIRLPLYLNPGNSAALAVAVRPGTELVYVGGWTDSAAFPTTINALQPEALSSMLLTTKRSGWFSVIQTNPDSDLPRPTGTRPTGVDALYYSTYISSRCADRVNAVAIGVWGDAFIGGATEGYGADDWFCGSVPYDDSGVQTYGDGFLYMLPAYERATGTGEYYFLTYLDDPVIAVAPRQYVGFDAITSNKNTGALKLLRGSSLPGRNLTIDQKISLGNGRFASMVTLQLSGDVPYNPWGQMLIYNSTSTTVTAATIDIRLGATLEPFYSAPGNRAVSIATTFRDVYVGFDALPPKGGYLGRMFKDMNPNDDNLNMVHIRVPDDQWAAAENQKGKYLSLTAEATYALDGSHPLVTCSHPLVGYFPLGRTDVTCTADVPPDTKNNNASFSVIVSSEPTLLVPATFYRAATGLTTPVAFAIVAWDIFGDVPNAWCDVPSGFGFPLGETVVNCKAIGGHSGVSSEKSFKVVIYDATPPVLSGVPAAYTYLGPTETRSFFVGITANDLFDGGRPVWCELPSGPPQATPFNLTLAPDVHTTVTCVASDAAGNTVKYTFAVKQAGDHSGPVVSLRENDNPWWKYTFGHVTAPESRTDGAVAYLTNSEDACAAFRQQYVVEHFAYLFPQCSILRAVDEVSGPRPIVCAANGQSIAVDGTVQKIALTPDPNVTCTSADHIGNVTTAVIGYAPRDWGPGPPPDAKALWPGLEEYQDVAPMNDEEFPEVFYKVPTAVSAADGSPLTVECSPAPGSRFEWGYDGYVHGIGCSAYDEGGAWMGDAGLTLRLTRNVQLPPAINSWTFAQDVQGTTATAVFQLYMDYTPLVPTQMFCSLDEADFAPCERDVTLTNLTAGDHRLRMKTQNANGHSEVTSHVWQTEFTLDTTPPVFEAPADIRIEATMPQGAVAFYDAPIATDGEGTLAVPCAPDSGSTFAVGTTLVTCSVADEFGNTARGLFTVTVDDTTAPLITVPGDITVETADASGVLVPYTVSALDVVDGAVAVSCDGIERYLPGTRTVTCSASDRRGNMAVASFGIDVILLTPPTLTLPADVAAEATSGDGHAVTFPDAIATDARDGDLSPNCAPASGSQFPVGATVVTCAATNSAGLTSEGSFMVTVSDTTAPIIDARGDETAPASSAAGAAVHYAPPATHDLVDGDGVASCLPVPGATFIIGDTVVTCSATDAHGNTAATSFTVKVTNNAPTFTPSAPIRAEATSTAGAVVSFTASGDDVEDGRLAADCSPASGSTFAIGDTTVNCTVKDVAHATASGAFVVSVVDTIAPIVSYTGNAGSYDVADSVAIQCAAADSGSGVAATTCADINGPAYTFAPGVNTFTATATDVAGNAGEATTSFTVVVTNQSLQALVTRFVTNPGIAGALNTKLQQAASAPNANARAGQLKAFENQLNGQIGKTITAADAAIVLRLLHSMS